MTVTPSEFRAALVRLGIRQVETAAVLGRSKDTVSRYALGKLPVPEQDRRILWACERDPSLLAALRNGIDTPP